MQATTPDIPAVLGRRTVFARSAVVYSDLSVGGHWASERHLPSLVCTAIGGSATVGVAPLRKRS